MAFSKEKRPHTFSGIWFVAMFAFAAMYIAQLPVVSHLGFSPLTIAIILGMIYGNTLYQNIPSVWMPGIIFSMKQILRFGIILYGFRITFQQIAAVGMNGVVVDALVLTSTFVLGTIIGMKVFKLDRDTAMLTSSGASICGAAAVLATEPVLKSEPHKTALAVATVVLFGTIAMFSYPMIYQLGLFNEADFGIYVGATVHEVAQVVAVGNAISPTVMDNAVIVKMTRVMMLAPFLIILGYVIARMSSHLKGEKSKILIPWFAVWFVVVAGFNSLHLLPQIIVDAIIQFDMFCLTMAMAALGMETNLKKFKTMGMGAIWLAAVLFLWLLFGGYAIMKVVG